MCSPRLGPEKEHIVIPATGRIRQVSEQLVRGGGLAGPEVHLEVSLVGEHNHHRPRLRLGQTNGGRQLLAREGAVARGPDVVVDAGDRMDGVNALHVAEHVLVEEVLAEQDGRGTAGTEALPTASDSRSSARTTRHNRGTLCGRSRKTDGDRRPSLRPRGPISGLPDQNAG